MSLESVGVLKLQVCSGQLISGGRSDSLAAKRQRLYRRRLEAQERLSTGGASGRGIGTVPSGSAGGVHLWT
jgi:hypothetical protein